MKLKDHNTADLLPSREIVNPDKSPVMVPLKEVFHLD
jgi:L-rhamnose mutarotase